MTKPSINGVGKYIPPMEMQSFRRVMTSVLIFREKMALFLEAIEIHLPIFEILFSKF